MTKKPHDGGLSRRWMLRRATTACRASARDYIDIYYLHIDDRETPIAETVAAIGDADRSGKIRYFGVSNFRGWRIAEVVSECEAQGVPLPVVCQPYYNLLEPRAGSRDPARLRLLRDRRREQYAERRKAYTARQLPRRRSRKSRRPEDPISGLRFIGL